MAGDVFVFTFLSLLYAVASSRSWSYDSHQPKPCIFQGYVNTRVDWFGFLANITIGRSGRVLFDFRFPANHCCPTVLFYTDNQVHGLAKDMTCYSKKAKAKALKDHPLHLSPRFTYSGCFKEKKFSSVDMYVCKGGISLDPNPPVESMETRYYIAISHCADDKYGFNLRYELVVEGHVAKCKNGHHLTTLRPPLRHPSTVERPHSVKSGRKDERNICIIKGILNTTTSWYGWLANFTLNSKGGFRFSFSFPFDMQTEKILLYTDAEARKLNSEMQCHEKTYVLPVGRDGQRQIDLRSDADYNGCNTVDSPQGSLVVCKNERTFEKPQSWRMAVSNCHLNKGLWLNYKLELFGFRGNPCCACRTQFYAYYFILLRLLTSFLG